MCQNNTKAISGAIDGKLRDELLNGELFYTLQEAQVLVEAWRNQYNHYRPHSALGYRPPAPEAIQLFSTGVGQPRQPGLT